PWGSAWAPSFPSWSPRSRSGGSCVAVRGGGFGAAFVPSDGSGNDSMGTFPFPPIWGHVPPPFLPTFAERPGLLDETEEVAAVSTDVGAERRRREPRDEVDVRAPALAGVSEHHAERRDGGGEPGVLG